MGTAQDDLTGRARLRDAAIECFASRGFGESLRAIAARAGVSAGLVRHHFGSKEKLRAECDATVLERYRGLKVNGMNTPPTRLFAQLPASRDGGMLMVYILRSVQDGSPAGRRFVENMVAEALGFTADAVTRGIVVPSRNEESRARFMVQQSIGGMLVNLAMRPEVQLDDFPAVMEQYMADSMLPTLEVYTEGVFTERTYLDEYLAYLAINTNPPASLAGETATR